MTASLAVHSLDMANRDASVVGLRFANISKRFGDVLANDNITFDVERGTIHAIVGENGAGKSTLTKILYGYYRADSGSLFMNGKPLNLSSPADARRLGIGMVHQQLALLQSLRGFENVVLGDPRIPFYFSKRELEKRVLRKAQALGFNLDLSCPVADLGVADRQKLEIFKLLWRDAQVLILDEPTSQLTPLEADEILKLISDLAAAGKTVLLITHHISEVMRFAKRITVLRKGKCVTTIDTNSVECDELAKLMVESSSIISTPIKKAQNTDDLKPLLSLKEICTNSSRSKYSIKDISLDLRAGEIVGVAGISGSGQYELGLVIAGLLGTASGEISSCLHKDKFGRTGENVSYIPGVQEHAVAAELSIATNCFLKKVSDKKSQTLGFIKSKTIQNQTREVVSSFQVTPAMPEIPAKGLSGGNLQRLIVGRELASKASIVVADNPCAGLDLATSMRVLQALRQTAEEGRAVLLISPDLEELIKTCDRIIVMFNGRIVGEQRSGHFDYHALAVLMGGGG